MRKMMIRLYLSALLIGSLAACQQVTLIELNKDFVDLMLRTEEANRLHRSGVLS